MLLTAAHHKLGVALNAISLKFPHPIKGSLHRSWKDGSMAKQAHCFSRVSSSAFTTQVRCLKIPVTLPLELKPMLSLPLWALPHRAYTTHTHK